MRKTTAFILTAFFLLASFIANAGRPVDGTTAFTTTSTGLKASGNAGVAGGITAINVEGFNFNLTTAVSGPVMNIEVWDGAVSSGNGVAFYESTSTVNPPITGITITSNDGTRFDLVSLGINATNSSNGNATVTVTGLNASGNPVSGATITGVASATALSVFSAGTNNAFKSIFGIRITSSDMNYAFIDNITLANVGSTLPVTLMDFTAKKGNKGIRLNWQTAMEQDAESFSVQHSTDAINWTTIGRVNAAGNSQSTQYYNYLHVDPNPGNNHYRLIERDRNGKQTISKVVALSFVANNSALSVYPNPVTGSIVTVQLAKPGQIQIRNSSGIVVLQKQLQATVQQVEVSQLPKGIYTLTAEGETRTILIH